ncbi:septal ring lytic transglycosylase RlpA family protein [Pseudarcicella hirudinis]|uniref:septal ring lytic transglycosylase RlpA family protein n=1 Tax=Pseudarcicella hirudinis TaxID=1079859 RepID=UPI0035ED12B9
MLEVTNQSNGSKAIVRVNDRGPHTRSRVIDVSYKAAKQLGLLSKGSAHVRIKVLSLGSGALLAEEESEEDTLSDENTEEVAQNPLQQPIETDSLNQRKFVVIVYDQDGRIKLDSTNSQPKVILVRK